MTRRVDWQARKGGFAAFIRDQVCPCGGGLQTLRHLTRFCSLPKVCAARERVLECMDEVDASGDNEQWHLIRRELRRPGQRPESLLDDDVDEGILGIIIPGTKGVAANGASAACGGFVRAVSALLTEDVRVASSTTRRCSVLSELSWRIQRYERGEGGGVT